MLTNLLPIKFPYEHEESVQFFNEKVAQKLLPLFIHIMDTGILLDMKEVQKLETIVNTVLTEVENSFKTNKVIKEFLTFYNKIIIEEKLNEVVKKTEKDFKINYKTNNIVHRSKFINYLLEIINEKEHIKEKWTIKDIKNFIDYTPNKKLKDYFLIILKKKETTLPIHRQFIDTIAKKHYKLYINNKIERIKIDNKLDKFNPNSDKQKLYFFSYLGIKSEKKSKKTGNDSWDRKSIEKLLVTTTDKELKEILKLMIDHSYGAIIKNNFIKAFKLYSFNNVLYGNLKLFGTKTFRPTSNNPNLLNMPSTGSIYAKPLKKCFIAPKGYLVWSIDYAALEDRVAANLTRDKNKIAIFTEHVDGHSLGAATYFKKEVVKLVGEYETPKKGAILLRKLIDNGNKKAEELRQNSKPITFGLSYGAFPKKIAETIKCDINTAEKIFDAYNNELFPDINKYKNKIVLKQAKEKGYIHLGLGCRLYTDNPEKDIRTLHNATMQFWSILTLMAAADLLVLIEKENKDIKINSTIYDAIYGYVKNDPKEIEWLNNTIVKLMTKDFLENQIVKNEANLEIGLNWSELYEIPNNASSHEINKILNKIKKKDL